MPRSDQYMQDAADRVMITDLLARYVWAVDYGTPGDWADVFTPDGVFEAFGGKMQVRGRARLMAFAADLKRTVPDLHHVTTSLVIELNHETGGNRARCKSQLNEFMSRPEAIYPNLHGWYQDDLVFGEGGWLFERRRVHVVNPENTRTGNVGEHFQAFFDACQAYMT